MKAFADGKHRTPLPKLKFPDAVGSTKKTVSLRFCPGVILLAGDACAVEADEEAIRRIEREGLLSLFCFSKWAFLH